MGGGSLLAQWVQFYPESGFLKIRFYVSSATFGSTFSEKKLREIDFFSGARGKKTRWNKCLVHVPKKDFYVSRGIWFDWEGVEKKYKKWIFLDIHWKFFALFAKLLGRAVINTFQICIGTIGGKYFLKNNHWISVIFGPWAKIFGMLQKNFGRAVKTAFWVSRRKF